MEVYKSFEFEKAPREEQEGIEQEGIEQEGEEQEGIEQEGEEQIDPDELTFTTKLKIIYDYLTIRTENGHDYPIYSYDDFNRAIKDPLILTIAEGIIGNQLLDSFADSPFYLQEAVTNVTQLMIQKPPHKWQYDIFHNGPLLHSFLVTNSQQWFENIIDIFENYPNDVETIIDEESFDLILDILIDDE